MAKGAIVFRWGAATRGRERQSLDVFAESAAYFDDLAENGRITSHHPFISASRSGGMWVVQGEIDELEAVENEPDFVRLTTRVQMIVDDYQREHCYGGSVEELGGIMGMFAEAIEELA